jgi:hypothetical protein
MVDTSWRSSLDPVSTTRVLRGGTRIRRTSQIGADRHPVPCRAPRIPPRSARGVLPAASTPRAHASRSGWRAAPPATGGMGGPATPGAPRPRRRLREPLGPGSSSAALHTSAARRQRLSPDAPLRVLLWLGARTAASRPRGAVERGWKCPLDGHVRDASRGHSQCGTAHREHRFRVDGSQCAVCGFYEILSAFGVSCGSHDPRGLYDRRHGRP